MERHAMLVTKKAECQKDSQFSHNRPADSMKMHPKSVASEFSREHDTFLLTHVLEGQKVKNKNDMPEDYE